MLTTCWMAEPSRRRSTTGTAASSSAMPCPATCASGDSAQQHLCTHSVIPKALPWALHPSQPRQGNWRTNHSTHRHHIPHENTAVNKQILTQTGFVGEGRKSSATFYLYTAAGISGAKLDFLKHRGQQQFTPTQVRRRDISQKTR